MRRPGGHLVPALGAALLGRLAGGRRVPLTVQVLTLRAFVPWLHDRLPLPDFLHLLAGPPATNGASPRGVPPVPEVFGHTEHWLRHRRLTRTTCLYRALIRYGLLRRSGARGLSFRLGLRTEDGELIGHAWLEQHGQPLGERLEHEYEITFQHPNPEDRR